MINFAVWHHISDWVASSKSQLCDDNSCNATDSSICIISTKLFTFKLNSLNLFIGKSGLAVGNLDIVGVIIKRDFVSTVALGNANM